MEKSNKKTEYETHFLRIGGTCNGGLLHYTGKRGGPGPDEAREFPG
jgi:hypothetical protein